MPGRTRRMMTTGQMVKLKAKKQYKAGRKAK